MALLEFDELKMYFREDYKVNDYITIHQPSVSEVVEYGEKEYYSMVSAFTCIPSDMKSQLYDLDIDYEELPDFHLFMMLVRGLPKEKTKIFFGDFDFTELKVYSDNLTNEILLYNPSTKQKLDRLAYIKIAGYLRKLHNITPKVEKAKNKTTKRILIQMDRDRIKKSQNQEYKSQLKPLISAMMRYPGFKYNMAELKNCGLYEFMDTVKGAQIYVNSTALLQGSYSGMIDASKINKNEFNWLRES